MLIIFLTIVAASVVFFYSTINPDHPVKKTGTNILSFLIKYCTHEFTKPFVIVLHAASFLPLLIYLLLAATLCLGLPSYAAYSAGQKIAAKNIENFRESGCTANPKTNLDTCVLIKDENGKILHEGLLVAINNKAIALFDKEGSHIFAKKEGFVIHRKLY